MSKSKVFSGVILLTVASLVLSACAPAATPAPTPTPVPPTPVPPTAVPPTKPPATALPTAQPTVSGRIMPTPIFLTGFESGVLSTGSSGLFDTAVGSPTIEAGAARSGSYGLRIYTSTSAVEYVGFSLSTPTVVVGRMYVKYAAWPGVDNEIVWATVTSGAELAIKLNASSHKLFARFWGVADGNTYDTALSLGTWYRVDFKFDVSANPSKIDFQVDGNAVAQSTYAQAATTFTGLRLGVSNSGTVDLYIDDVTVSTTSADYPIGPGQVDAFLPRGGGTHKFSSRAIGRSGRLLRWC